MTYQFKILTTAFFSVMLLDRTLSRSKWLALGILTMGIGLVVLPKGGADDETMGNQANAKGLLSVFAACILSGVAGVYFEKIVKAAPAKSKEDVETSPVEKPPVQEQQVKVQLWIRNIQLSLFSVILGSVFVLGLQDGPAIIENGFFYNYTWMTWAVILIQAGGGLIVGLVVRYADNILKGFATSISIILSSVISFWLFQFEITLTFMIGCIFVVYATFLYGKSV